MTLPISDPVLIFALAMVILLIAPLIFERIRIPGIIGLIVAGAVVGPHVLNLLERDFTFELLGTVGLLYLVFLAGLELDLNRFFEYRGRSITFGLISFSVPMVLSVAVMPLLGFGMPAALLIGAIIGSHTLLAYPVASRLGIVKNPAVITVVGGTLVTDTLALTVLAIVAGSLAGDADAGFWLRLVTVLGIYVAVVLWGVPRLGRWFFRNVPSQAPGEFLFLMAVLFSSAFAAGLAGAEPIIGAFLAGLTLNRLIPENSPLMTRVRFVGNALFIPFFLLSVGMLVNPAVLVESGRVWVVAIALIVLVTLGKFAGAWATKMIFGYTREEGLVMFGLSVPQAAATLAVTFIGLEIGLFGEDVVNGVIMMILVTVLIGPTLIEKFGRRVALQEEQKPYDPEEAPQRILIPIANPATADALMDIAFILRGAGSDQPLYPLSVVREEGSESEARVAEAERMLAHAVIYASGADVPVVPLTRVDRNPANGILRGMAETRTSTVVVGWEGKGSTRGSVFGSVLDQVLEQTRQMVVVAKMGHPLNTTRRIILVIPPASDHHPGFLSAASDLKRFANELGVEVEALVIKDDPFLYERLYGQVRPQLPIDFEGVESFRDLLDGLHERLRPEDLVVVMSARRGTLAWHQELDRLPKELADLVPESFLMIYPSEVQTPADLEFTRDSLPSYLDPRRVILDLPGGKFEYALERLLLTHFTEDRDAVSRILSRIATSERQFSTEVRPGVVIPNALISDVSQPTVFLGISAEGVRFPNTQAPSHVIALVLSPRDRRKEHLKLLTRLGSLTQDEERYEALRACRTQDELRHWFADRALR